MRKPQWINPENLADKCAELFEAYGLEINEDVYKTIHGFVLGYNLCHRLKPPAMRSQCERARIHHEDRQ